jgi:hypothetical protein
MVTKEALAAVAAAVIALSMILPRLKLKLLYGSEPVLPPKYPNG